MELLLRSERCARTLGCSISDVVVVGERIFASLLGAPLLETKSVESSEIRGPVQIPDMLTLTELQDLVIVMVSSNVGEAEL